MFSASKRRAGRLDYARACKSPRLPSSSPMSSSSSPDTSRMKVCVRVRPLSEKEQGSKNIIDVVDRNMMVFDPVSYTEDSHQYSYHGKRYKEIGKRPNKNLQFVFDRLFDTNEDNITVYKETTKDLVNSLLAGFNCSVFAYGSTGSGKTHTMLGSPDDPGIIFFTTMDLYKHLEKEENKNLELSISYFEIYNEIFYDLLDPTSRQPLSAYEDANKGMIVKNLSVFQPRDADHLIQMLEFGNKNRKQHPTDANAESSRSHAIFQISLCRKEFSAQEMSIQVSKMSLIDLAGSERAKVAYQTFRSNNLHREGGNINKSLLALGNCINSLANNNNPKNNYIPYRSSKLTLILRDSLGGNCQTLMIATVSPSASHFEETHNTLLYAERAKGVQLNVRKNNTSYTVQPRDYKHVVDKLNAEKTKMQNIIDELKNEVQKYKNQAESIPNEPIFSTRDSVNKLNSVKTKLDMLFAQRLELRQKLLETEHNIKMIDLRLMFRKTDNERLAILNEQIEDSDKHLKSSGGLHHLHTQKLHYVNLQSSLVDKVQENDEEIKRFENELMSSTNDDIVIESFFSKNNSIAQSKDLAFGETHTAKIFESVFERLVTADELIKDSFHLNYRLYNLVKAQGLLTDDSDTKFKNIIKNLEGKKSVVWKDNLATPKMSKMKEMIDLAKLPLYQGGSNLTPIDKRSLVSVLDITPNPHVMQPQQNRTPLHIVNSNIANHRNNNLGNTITKKPQLTGTVTKSSRNVNFKWPSSRLYQF